jgi:hypothetical protein
VRIRTMPAQSIALGALVLCGVLAAMPAFASGDATPPWTFLTSPGPGVTIAGEQAISGWAMDLESGIKWVRISVDGAPVSTVYLPPGRKLGAAISLQWDTRSWPNGRHTIKVRVVNGADLFSDIERALTVANTVADYEDSRSPLSFAGTWSSPASAAPRPDDPLVGVTVDAENRLTLWAISRGRQGVFCSAQGVLNPDGSFDLLSREGSVRVTGQIAGDRQSVQATVTPPGLAPFSVTGREWPDFNPLSRRWAGTFTGAAPTANGQVIHVELSIDPSGNATCQTRVGSLQQSSICCVTPDGRVLLPGGSPDFPIGSLTEVNGTKILRYRFWHPDYPDLFQVPLQPFQPSSPPPVPPPGSPPPPPSPPGDTILR